MTELRGLELAQDTVNRIYTGRAALRMLGGDPSLKNLEIVMGERLWGNLHIHLNKLGGTVVRNIARPHGSPHGLLIWGLPARRDPALPEDDVRFRSEVAL